MKKFTFILFVIAALLGACVPQATATPEATATSTPPPTETPIPTPTLHPQFAALQEQIAKSGRFILNLDGTIQDGEKTIPGLTVSSDGVMTLKVDGEEIALDPAQAVFDDENGFSYPGYEQNADGEWVASEAPAEKQLKQALKDLVVAINTLAVGELNLESGNVTLINKESGEVKYNFVSAADSEGNITLADLVTGEVVYKNGRWDLSYVRLMISESSSCQETEWVGDQVGHAWPEKEGKIDAKKFSDKYSHPLFIYYRSLVDQRILPSYGTQRYTYEYFGNSCWGILPSIRDEQTESVLLFRGIDSGPKYISVFMSSTKE